MNKTDIEWCHYTWNVTRGCSKAGRDCDNCYAMRIAARFSGPGLAFEGFAKMVDGKPEWTGKLAVVNVNNNLTSPMRVLEPSRIFVNSTSDLFHGKLPFESIDPIVAVELLCNQHRSITLTKRGGRLASYWRSPGLWGRLQRHADVFRTKYPAYGGVAIPDPSKGIPHHLWQGVSAGYQEVLHKRTKAMMAMAQDCTQILSLEPLIGPLDLRNILRRGGRIKWVIAGAESGPGHRDAKLDWLRSIRDQCVRNDVAFFLKQWVGEPIDGEIEPHGTWAPRDKTMSLPLLDGQQWAQYPSVHATDYAGVEGS